MKRILIPVFAICTYACAPVENKEPQEYKGPLREVENMELFYTEENLVKVKMKAAMVYEFMDGDREFPKGIYMEFYDVTGRLESTLKANHAYFFKKENQWRGRGDVIVKNLLKDEQLNTEELFWKPIDKKIFTEKFVTIRQQRDVIYGQGMNAKQDLSDFEMQTVTGDFEVKEDQ
ncbi:MAG: LPS export ABC transporter periplasmic protein LptC [Cyclobacteriaceae bacterium]|jgi:LPS export ABC transporter protein LptC|nr:LPS export ABC transporter periplasmic protein LptC [Flammeovirgaceae bacterium]MCZ8022535.1 LPS export ABC transporter periplasmic protein LptC [Cytophagales bacterium]MCZ8328932.1 LPS export ABC transporter periplasmic protein LptC [Cyclobacteriaceae bacterium]